MAAGGKNKKELKAKTDKVDTDKPSVAEDVLAVDVLAVDAFNSKAALKAFLLSIRDKMTDEVAAPVYAASAINHVLTHPLVYDHLDGENKEIARDIWLRLKASGLQLRNPPLLFGS